jgi:hypothetical protein
MMIKETASENQDVAPQRMVIVLNFFEELKDLVAAK